MNGPPGIAGAFQWTAVSVDSDEGGPPAVRRESVVQGAGPQPVAVARGFVVEGETFTAVADFDQPAFDAHPVQRA